MNTNMKYYLSLILICAGLHIHAQTGLYIPELAKFDSAMLDLMKTYNVPGGQLAIAKDGKKWVEKLVVSR